MGGYAHKIIYVYQRKKNIESDIEAMKTEI